MPNLIEKPSLEQFEICATCGDPLADSFAPQWTETGNVYETCARYRC